MCWTWKNPGPTHEHCMKRLLRTFTPYCFLRIGQMDFYVIQFTMFHCLLIRIPFETKEKKKNWQDYLSLQHSAFRKHVAEQLASQTSFERREKKKKNPLPWHTVNMWFWGRCFVTIWSVVGGVGCALPPGTVQWKVWGDTGAYRMRGTDKDCRMEQKRT